MKFDVIFDLINELLEDISSINDKESNKTFKRKLDGDNIKGMVNLSLEKKTRGKSKEESKSFKNRKDPSDYELILQSFDFDPKLDSALRQVAKRNNQVWKDPSARKLLFKSYLECIDKIFTKKISGYDKIIKYTSPYKLSSKVLDSLMIVAEVRLREEFTIFAKIDKSKASLFLEENGLDGLLDFFKENLESFYKNLSDDRRNKIYKDYLKANPTKVNDRINFIENADLLSQIDLAKSFMDDDNSYKFKRSLSRSKSKYTSMIGFYYLRKAGKLSKADLNRLFKIIHEENLSRFEGLVKDNDLSIELIEKLLDLDEKASRKITIDRSKVKKSRKELKSTVARVSEFMDYDEDIPEEKNLAKEESKKQEDNEKIDKILDPKIKDFLRQVYDNKGVGIDEASDFALSLGMMVNGLMDQINESLYTLVEDQTLYIDDDKVVIDPFYEDMVKEILDGSD